MFPVAAKLPDVGLYSSALDMGPPLFVPPAINTVPSPRTVAVCKPLGVFMLPVGVNWAVFGS